LLVTINDDDGKASTEGTLSYALKSATSGQVISFALTGGSTITIHQKLPTMQAGVKIQAGCDFMNGPAITLNGSGVSGDGLILSGQNQVRGLKIMGFSDKQLVLNGTGNHLSCLVIQE
jgi:hypothetical protein